MSLLSRVMNWARELPRGVSRWPGAAVRISSGTRADAIDFRRGRVINVSDLSIFVEMDHPLFKGIKLMGDAYIHYCPNCTRTIPGNVTYRRSAGTVEHNGQTIPIRFFCPYCGPDHLLRMMQPGDKVRLHYRFDLEQGWAGWYAEVWDW
jgi:predicted RNA-binding Zn-ribbon protein involved in translation (DUF1610 family)